MSTDVKAGRALRLGEQCEVRQRSTRQEAEVLVTLVRVSPLAVLLGEGVTLLTSPSSQCGAPTSAGGSDPKLGHHP